MPSGVQACLIPDWNIYIFVPVATFLVAFAKSFGSSLGDQGAEAIGKAFASWVNRMHKVAHPGSIILEDNEKHLVVELPEGLSSEAFIKLGEAAERLPESGRDKKSKLVFQPNGGWVPPQ
jgi:hypothetical protein